MKCRKCQKDVEKFWNFCPNCGRKLDELGPRFPSFGFVKRKNSFEEDDVTDIEQQMEQEIGKMFKMFGAEGMPNIKIKFGTIGGQPMQRDVLQEQTAPKPRKTPEKIIQRKIEKTEEPEAKIKKIGSKIEIIIELPGVDSLKDIILKRYEESLEIRAYAGKKMYFKVIPIPKNSKLSEKSFNKKQLVLILNS